MFGKPSLVTRIAVGKAVGLLFGVAGFLAIPGLLPEATEMLRWGVLLWYVTLGGLVGLSGVIDRYPLLGVPIPWWLRGPLIAAWMNFVLTLLMYPPIRAFSEALLGLDGWLASPFWFVAEGAVVGLVIGYAATRAGGEGPATARALERGSSD